MFNIIVTTYRNMEHEASSEINALLNEIGDASPELERTGLAGLLTCRTSLDPAEAIRRIRKITVDDPWRVRYVLRLIPVETVVDADILAISEAVDRLAARIKEGETFRVTVEKRRSQLHTSDIIDAIAKLIDRKVSLEKHDWVVLVEVIGSRAGISVIKPDDIFSAVKTKRALE